MWDVAAVIGDCLRSLFESDAPGVEAVVVDNASSDGTIGLIKRDFPQVEIVETGANLGFAPVANIGLRQARGSGTCFSTPMPDCSQERCNCSAEHWTRTPWQAPLGRA